MEPKRDVEEYEVKFRVKGITLADGSKLSAQNIEDVVWGLFDCRFAPDRNELDCAIVGQVNITKIK